jgi:hypothetical protein
MLRKLAIVLLLAGPSSLSGQIPEKNPYAGWPQTWKETYHRFENYNAACEKSFSRPNLEILPDGRIFHTVQLFRDRAEHLDVVTYRNGYGAGWGGRDPETPLFSNNGARWYPPGIYAATLMSCGMAGYQNLYPMVWFEVLPGEPGRDGHQTGDLAVRMVEPPAKTDEVWPNERLLKFLDFHVFPNHNPTEIYKKNAKVSPCVTLGLTNSGTITRDKLEPSLEKLLHWRIFHNGHLIEGGSANNSSQFNADRGPGTYQAFVGLEGPNGFMPVSNFLQFPLFPEKSGKNAVFPSATNAHRFPDFLLEILPPDQLNELLAEAHSGPENASYYNKRAIAILRGIGPFQKKSDEDLFILWENWSWHINMAIQNQREGLTGLAGVLEKPKAPGVTD